MRQGGELRLRRRPVLAGVAVPHERDGEVTDDADPGDAFPGGAAEPVIYAPGQRRVPGLAHPVGDAGQVVDRALGEQERAFHDAPVLARAVQRGRAQQPLGGLERGLVAPAALRQAGEVGQQVLGHVRVLLAEQPERFGASLIGGPAPAAGLVG